MFRDAQVGDKVWSIVHGFGKIVSIKSTLTYPLNVKFSNVDDDCISHLTFDFEGKLLKSSINPILFWKPIEIPFQKRPVKKSFKDFLRANNICFDDFIENCKVENQRFSNPKGYYENIYEEFNRNPINFVENAFSWERSIYFSREDMENLNEKWKAWVSRDEEIVLK